MYQRASEWAVVVAQLVERLIATPEVCGLNPVISEIFIEHLFAVNCIEKTKIKRSREWPILKKQGYAHIACPFVPSQVIIKLK